MTSVEPEAAPPSGARGGRRGLALKPGPALRCPLPQRPQNRLLRLKPDTGRAAPCSYGSLGPRGARRKDRSGIPPEGASCSGCGVAVLPLPAAAERGDIAEKPAPAAVRDPVRGVPPARMQGQPLQLLSPSSAPTGSNQLELA